MTEVVAALLWEGDRFLACQRPSSKARGLLWEFAGGKVEPGEAKEQALVRECREELGVTVIPGRVFMEVTHEYPDLTVRLTLYNAVIGAGAPQALEHADLRWITVDEIDEYEFCPADDTILAALKRRRALEASARERLFRLRDETYQAFTAKLIPTIPSETIIGVRTPAFRRFAREFSKEPGAGEYLTLLPHRYFEENSLHGSLLADIGDYDQVIAALDEFLPYVDNWATCDTLSPKLFKKHPERLPSDIRRWMASPAPYTVRFGIGMLMAHYLDEHFAPEYLDWVAAVRSEEYYVNMMVAWYFATALAKQYPAAIPYVENARLPLWPHNRTIQKAIESRRIPEDRKDYLRTLRRRASRP